MKDQKLLLIAFGAGLSTMAIELSASRLLSPYFGSSQIVWTSIIGLIMIAMSLGGYTGGKLADRDLNPNRLGRVMLIAAIYTACIPFISKFCISLSVLPFTFTLQEHISTGGSLLACVFLFAVPSFLLGMVSPFIIRLRASSLGEVGHTTGSVYAISTFGSIIGTFLPTFVTIPYLGTKKTFMLVAVFLVILSLVTLLDAKKKLQAAGVLIIVSVLFWTSGTSIQAGDGVIYEGESIYNYIQVIQDGQSRKLVTNDGMGVHSTYNPETILLSKYYDYFLAAPLFNADFSVTKPLKVLVLGLGAGTCLNQYAHFYDNVQITGVELDGKIVELAYTYFGLPKDRFDIRVTDARTYLRGTKEMYDVIIIDVYQDLVIPFHLATREFFTEVKEHLAPEGAVAINVGLNLENNQDLTEYVGATLNEVFPQVFYCKAPTGPNNVVFGLEKAESISNYQANLAQIKDVSLQKTLGDVAKKLQHISGTKEIWTDDRAPVEQVTQQLLKEVGSRR